MPNPADKSADSASSATPSTPTLGGGAAVATIPTTPVAAAASSSLSVAAIKLDLPVGAVVATPSNRYTILSHLADSGLTKVYLVVNQCRARHVMRVEYSKIPRVASRIKRELSLLEALKHVEPDDKSHFLKLYDKGRTPIFKFMVVSRVGPTLLQIREKLLEQDDFSEYTAFYIAVGTFQALRDLHNAEFLHRDIHLGRFAIGVSDYSKQIFMYNLKDLKRFMTPTGHIVRAKEATPFEGSMLFSSRNAMNGREVSRRDDLESWLYMIFDVYDRQTFTQYFDHRKLSEAISIKQGIMEEKFSRNFFNKIPREYAKICRHIRSLKWDSKPNYDLIYEVLRSTLPSNNGELRCDEFLDWTGKITMKKGIKDIEQAMSAKKALARPDIVTLAEWNTGSETASGEDDAPLSGPPREPIKRSAEPMSRSRQSTRRSIMSRSKMSGRKTPTRGRKSRNDEMKSVPSSEMVEPDGKSAGRVKASNKGGRRPRPSNNSKMPPSRERMPPSADMETPSYNGVVSREPLNASESVTPSKEQIAATTPTKKTGSSMSAAEKLKHAERIRRQMHVNVTDTTEEEPNFNFIVSKKPT